MATKAKQPEIIPTKDIYAGTQHAPVTVTAYMDYESEACADFNEVLKELLSTFEGSIRFNIRHFPLTKIHQRAHKAAEAAIAAGQEGKFWEMHNLLFYNRKNLGTISLKAYAKEAGITNKRFLDDLVNSVYSWHVRGDLLDALEKGVRDVPFVFVNNVRVQTLSYNHLSKIINDILKTKA